MKGDFSRVTFDPLRYFTRVLRQQGRVSLDADFNEQVALFWHYLRRLAADVIGPHGGPEGHCAFEILEPDGDVELDDGDFVLSDGHYYVDGLLCEVESSVQYTDQPYWKPKPLDDDYDQHLIYLDVWERHVSYLQDGRIREVALGGPDTATRAQVVWQVKATDEQDWNVLDEDESRGFLKVLTRHPGETASTDPCITKPEARYRGPENQLYRVEIHRSGPAKSDAGATFKWSRENGSVAFPIRKLEGTFVTLDFLTTDDRLGLKVGDRVEVTDDGHVLQGEPGILAEVEAVDPLGARVTLKTPMDLPEYDRSDPRHPLLRRWDYRPGDPSRGGLELENDGALPVVENENQWIVLEDGIEIQFVPSGAGEANTYRNGDYWWFAARTVTGEVEWPGPPGEPDAVPPHGVEHHYAPLAIVTRNGDDLDVDDKRRKFKTLPLSEDG